MFTHVLVPTDFTEKSRAALAVAGRLADLEKGRLTLLHVIETLDGAEGEEFTDFYDKLKAHAQANMDKLIRRCSDRQPPPQAVILLGKRAPEIVRYAHEQAVDLIVLSSHRIDPDAPGTSLGTVSYKVAIMAACPVMMVK